MQCLNFFKNKFTEYLKASLKVSDNLVKIDNDILMRKNEFDINSKNIKDIIKNDMLIFRANCIKLKSMIRENIKLVKNIKNNVYSVKRDCGSIQIDLKKLKEEFNNNFNKRAKTRSIITAKIRTYSFKRRMRALSKNNAACTIKDSGIVDVCTSTDDLIVKKYVDACTSIDDVCTNENEPCTYENEPCNNEKNHGLMKMNHVLMKVNHVLMKMNRVLMKMNHVLMKMNRVLAMMMMMMMMMMIVILVN